jgi:hypothetical protein
MAKASYFTKPVRCPIIDERGRPMQGKTVTFHMIGEGDGPGADGHFFLRVRVMSAYRTLRWDPKNPQTAKRKPYIVSTASPLTSSGAPLSARSLK